MTHPTNKVEFIAEGSLYLRVLAQIVYGKDAHIGIYQRGTVVHIRVIRERKLLNSFEISDAFAVEMAIAALEVKKTHMRSE